MDRGLAGCSREPTPVFLPGDSRGPRPGGLQPGTHSSVPAWRLPWTEAWRAAAGGVRHPATAADRLVNHMARGDPLRRSGSSAQSSVLT